MPGYRSAQPGAEQQSPVVGNMDVRQRILRDGANARYMSPSWQGTATVARILPGRNYAYSPDDPYASFYSPFQTGPGMFGSWFVPLVLCKNWGKGANRATFALGHPANCQLEQQPCHILQRTLHSIKDEHSVGRYEWRKLLEKEGEGNKQQSAALSQPQIEWCVQVELYMHKSVSIYPPLGLLPDKQSLVLHMPKTAVDSFKNQLTNFPQLDPVGIEGGVFVRFSEAGSPQQPIGVQAVPAVPQFGGMPGQQGQPGQPPAVGAIYGAQMPQQRNAGARYAVDFFTSLAIPGMPSSPSLVDREPIVRQTIKPWFDIIDDQDHVVESGLIQFMDPAAQMQMLTQFVPPDALEYVFRDRMPELLPDWVAGEAEKLRKMVTSVGYTPGYQQPPVQGYQQPPAPMYQQPATMYQQPQAPAYQQPQAPVYQQPQAPYQQPPAPAYQPPQAPAYQPPAPGYATGDPLAQPGVASPPPAPAYQPPQAPAYQPPAPAYQPPQAPAYQPPAAAPAPSYPPMGSPGAFAQPPAAPNGHGHHPGYAPPMDPTMAAAAAGGGLPPAPTGPPTGPPAGALPPTPNGAAPAAPNGMPAPTGYENAASLEALRAARERAPLPG